MSDAAGSPIPQFLKYMDARVALALARAGKGGVSQNRAQLTNAATVGPAGTIALSTLVNFPTRTGLVLVVGYGTVVGGTAVAGDSCTFKLLRDGAALPGAPITTQAIIASGNFPSASGVLAWFDTVTPGSSHSYAIQAAVTNGSGHTIEYPFAGAGSGGYAGLLLIDWPG